MTSFNNSLIININVPRDIKVHEIKKDDDLGLSRKDVNFPNITPFETPTVSFKNAKTTDPLVHDLKINEITRQIKNNVISSLEEQGTSRFVKGIRSQFLKNKVNLTIFDLRLDNIPNESSLRTLSQTLYSSSDAAILLPTVKTSFLQEKQVTLGRNGKPRDKKVFSMDKINKYINMMNTIINEINFKNNKPFIGTIPLIPSKFSRPIIQFYLSNRIKAFAIDANTKDVLLNEADLRIILSEIDDSVSLNESFIYACNLGIPQFEQDESRADDFLSLFAYIDVFGGSFKPRGISRKILPRTKIFSRDKYSYDIYPMMKIKREYEIASYNALKDYNRQRQLEEANKVRLLTGEEKIKTYLEKKSAVDSLTIKRLETIAKKMKSTKWFGSFFR